MEFINHLVMQKNRDVLTYLIKTVGKNILSGKSIMNISLPVNICDYRSQTEMLVKYLMFSQAYRIKNHSYFLEAGADVNKVERLKLVVTNYVSSMHFLFVADKPFNPIIGETFQIKSGNSTFYAEQTSHHPPITNFYIHNPKFVMWGYIGMDFRMGANNATAKFIGNTRIRYNNGTEFNFTYSDFYMEGMVFGKTYVTFSSAMIIEDLVNL